jgi:hypothetical protein
VIPTGSGFEVPPREPLSCSGLCLSSSPIRVSVSRIRVGALNSSYLDWTSKIIRISNLEKLQIRIKAIASKEITVDVNR